MSPRVVKAQDADEVLSRGRMQSFSLRELSGAAGQHGGVSAFVFPTIGEIPPDATAPLDLDDALVEASRVIAQAESNRETIERVAYERGLTEAAARVEEELSVRSAVEISAMREQLAVTIEQLSELSAGIEERAEADVVRLALAIAKKIIHREAATDRDIVMGTARTALARLHGRSAVEIRLHPDDHEHVRSHQDKLGCRGSLEFLADASVAPGGCLVHTDAGDIDATIDSQIEEIADALLAPWSEEETV